MANFCNRLSNSSKNEVCEQNIKISQCYMVRSSARSLARSYTKVTAVNSFGAARPTSRHKILTDIAVGDVGATFSRVTYHTAIAWLAQSRVCRSFSASVCSVTRRPARARITSTAEPAEKRRGRARRATRARQGSAWRVGKARAASGARSAAGAAALSALFGSNRLVTEKWPTPPGMLLDTHRFPLEIIPFVCFLVRS